MSERQLPCLEYQFAQLVVVHGLRIDNQAKPLDVGIMIGKQQKRVVDHPTTIRYWSNFIGVQIRGDDFVDCGIADCMGSEAPSMTRRRRREFVVLLLRHFLDTAIAWPAGVIGAKKSSQFSTVEADFGNPIGTEHAFSK